MRKKSKHQAAELALLQRLFGQEGRLDVNGMHVAVRVTDARRLFGRNEVRIIPLAGEGGAWVMQQWVEIVPKAPREAWEEEAVRERGICAPVPDEADPRTLRKLGDKPVDPDPAPP